MATQLKSGDIPADPTRGPAQTDDFAAWAFHQAMLVRSGQFHLLDAAAIAEELDGLGRGEYNELVSQLRNVLTHLLKWDHQSGRRSRSWQLSIEEHRERAVQNLQDNPSLLPRWDQAVERAYGSARRLAANETGLPMKTFPEACPYDWQSVMERPVDFDRE